MITVEFSNLADMQKFCREIVALSDGSVVPEKVEIKKPKKAKEPEVPQVEIEPAAEEEVKEESTEAEATHTIEEVRAVLGQKQKEGKKEEVKALISSFGVEKLSQIETKDYGELIRKAGEL